MIIDSSEVVAILTRESDVGRYEMVVATAPNCRMSVINMLEAAIVVEARGGVAAGHELDVFLDKAGYKFILDGALDMYEARCMPNDQFH